MAASQAPKTTASTCAAETACGTHLFRIQGYSLHRGLGAGNPIHSATFAVGGYDWYLSFYPDGYTDECKDWVSAFVGIDTENAKVRALYDLKMIHRGAQLKPRPPFTWPNPSSRMEPAVFDSCEWGVSEFVHKSELDAYILDDALLIECNLAVIKFKEAEMQETKKKFEVQVPPSDLLDNLSDLLEAQDGADVSFKVQGEVFQAHKIILAMRSPVFKAEFYRAMRNKSTGNVTIEDRYAMERMKLMCERGLSESLDAENVATRLALADQHHCSQLKDACIEFINSSDRMDDVVASKGYEHLKRACPTILADIWEKAAKTRKI